MRNTDSQAGPTDGLGSQSSSRLSFLVTSVASLGMTVSTDKRVKRVLELVALLGLMSAKYVVCSGEADCAHAVLGNNTNFALLVCRDEYTANKEPMTGALLADLLRRSGSRGDARALAHNLLATSARSKALQILGKIEADEDRFEDGKTLLEQARELHVAEHQYREIALDDQALARVALEQRRFADTLRALDNCVTESRLAKDHGIEGYCHLSAAAALSDVGYFAAALEELEHAEPLLTLDRARAELEYQRGRVDMNNGYGPQRLMHLSMACAAFEHAIKYASTAGVTVVQRAAELQLVFALAERSATDPKLSAEATAHLEIARSLDSEGVDGEERDLLKAQIAYRRKDYALATSINSRLIDSKLDSEYRIQITVAQAEIGLATEQFDDAINWAKRGVEIAEGTRSPEIELRPWILSARRLPYELLFTALVRAGKLEDAIVAFDHWQGRTLLDQLARGDAASPQTLRLAAMQTDVLNRFVPSLSSIPVMKLADRETILAAVREVDLIALLVADDEVWRISSRHGQLDIVNIGVLAALEDDISAFDAHPTRAALGEQLGERLLGAEAFHKTDEALFVILDGGMSHKLAGLPVAALRRRGEPLIALRPLVFPPRISELGCVPPPPHEHSYVIADTRDNLEHARNEAIELGELYGFTTKIGREATSNALFIAGPRDHLHIAMHAFVEASGGSFDTYDRPTPALEISCRRGGPALVFLATCSSAAANDSELATSLATAFIASGSLQVIATLRGVEDAEAAEIASLFYARKGLDDPERTLAGIQAELAKTDNEAWPNFILYGHATCKRKPS